MGRKEYKISARIWGCTVILAVISLVTDPLGVSILLAVLDEELNQCTPGWTRCFRCEYRSEGIGLKLGTRNLRIFE